MAVAVGSHRGSAVYAYACFVVFGACGLLPWNVFMNAFKVSHCGDIAD